MHYRTSLLIPTLLFLGFSSLITTPLFADSTADSKRTALSPTAEGMQNQLPNGTGPTGNMSYTPDEIRNTSAETFLEHILNPEPGYNQFAAVNALSDKVKSGNPADRKSILALVTTTMFDKEKPVYQRYQCCYVLSASGLEQVVPDLIKVLTEDQDTTMRAVSAEALASFPGNASAKQALLKSAATYPEVQEVVSRRLGISVALKYSPAPNPAPVFSSTPVTELAPSGSPKPPIGPKRPVEEPLPWPFPGDYKEQNLFNNYQQATDIYIHSGLDLIHPTGTPVTAVGDGYVAAIYTNYPEWKTHYFFIVTPVKGGNRGWCYTHLDPETYTFNEGDFIHKGQLLGKLVDFSVGGQPGVSHLHLHYVVFSKDASGKVNVHSLLDPLYFFDWKDTIAPSFQALRFVPDGSLQELQPDSSGTTTVAGRVDILAGITDSAFPNEAANFGVPVVMLSISDAKHTMQRLVVDHRGDVGDETQTRPLYLSYDEKKTFFNPDSFPRYQVLRVTKTDGDGRITKKDAFECWDTAASDENGNPLWPNGIYQVNVYAWDIDGNRGVVGAKVRVENR